MNESNRKLTDSQFQIVLANIERKRTDFEDYNNSETEADSFQAGYIQAMLNYGIISSGQYENHYNIKPLKI